MNGWKKFLKDRPLIIEAWDIFKDSFIMPITYYLDKVRKVKLPCEGCMVIPTGCSQLCGQVERDKLKLKKQFIRISLKNSRISCPDCGSKMDICAMDSFPSMYQCERCLHFFTIGDNLKIWREEFNRGEIV